MGAEGLLATDERTGRRMRAMATIVVDVNWESIEISRIVGDRYLGWRRQKSEALDRAEAGTTQVFTSGVSVSADPADPDEKLHILYLTFPLC